MPTNTNAPLDELANKIQRMALTRHEVAELFGVSLGSVDRMLKRGTLRAVRIGQLVRIPRESCEELLRTGGAA
jgi:excisionase family DNA binding protein